MLRIMRVLGFPRKKNITIYKPVSIFLCDSLATLVSHNQVQKCLQTNLKPSNRLLYLAEHRQEFYQT